MQARRPQLVGGVYDIQTALELMNSWFLLSERDGEVGIYRIEDDGALTYLAMEHFKLLLANLLVDVSSQHQQSSSKLIGIDTFWLRHSQRRTCRRIVFEPSEKIGDDEYNLWRGFAVSPKPGFQRQHSLLRHIHRIICRRNKTKFKYLMRWLAWAVQNPHRPAEVVLVLMSNTEGSGKSTLGKVMLDIFGPRHGLLVDDKEQLLGKFNSHLETACFVCGEEVLWAGDPRTADALKSRITASMIPIDDCFRGWRAPWRCAFISRAPARASPMIVSNPGSVTFRLPRSHCCKASSMSASVYGMLGSDRVLCGRGMGASGSPVTSALASAAPRRT
jgi:hypothetical protein